MNLFYVDLYNQRAARSTSGDAFTFPEIVAGQTIKYGLRFLRWSGSYFEEDQPLAALRVSMGRRDARPESATFKIKIGSGATAAGNTTTAMDWNVSPGAMATALNAVADGDGDYSVDIDNGSYLIRRAGGEAITLSVVSNKLKPISTGRIGGTQIDGEWVYDLRLTQMPLAFSDSAERVLPEAPSISTIQDGGADPSGTFIWPEIQALYLPPLFRGTYQLRRGYAKTRVLDPADGPEELEEALNEILAPEEGTVAVTNPTDNTAHIQFGGELIGLNLDELIVQVYDAPPGDWSFDLDLDTASLRAALRETETITVPFEAEADIYLDADDPSAGTRTVKLWSTTVTVRRPLIWPDLASVQDVDWLRPASPIDYKPFTTNQIIVGQQHSTHTIGNGSATVFVLDHNLDTDEIAGVTVRENISGGEIVPSGWTAEVTSADSMTLTFDVAPTTDQYAVVITAAGPTSAFQSHTHTTAQVVGLDAILDDLGSRVETLEAILPSTGPAATPATSSTGLVTVIPEIAEVVSSKLDGETLWSDEGLNVAALPSRAPYLLPAVHDSTPTDPLPTPLPAAAADSVWIANGRTLIPGGGGIRSAYADDDQPVASDGRILYPATRSGTTTSYFPTAFERTLFAMAINDKMLAVNRTLEILFGVQAQLYAHTCNAQWVLSVQLGTFSTDTTPATTGLNLSLVNWASTPVFEQVIVLSRLAQSHFFGVKIQRKAAEFLLDQQIYGVWGGNNAAAPASANFAIRARLDRFDTENRDDPRGWLGWRLIGSIEVDAEGKQETKPAQARIY